METHTILPFAAASRAVRMAQETTRLDLLEDIDATVDDLVARAHRFHDMTAVFVEFAAGVCALSVESGVYVDSDFRITTMLEEAESVLKAYLPRMTIKRAAIDQDTRLSADHRESLHDAYEEAMTKAAFLHDAIQSARAAIIRHDMAAEPRDSLPVFDSVESLVADLRG
jgi:hypothetical protein